VRNSGKRYSDDFKKMIIQIYNSGKPVSEICSEYGITNGSLYSWIKNPPGNKSKKTIIRADTEPKAVNKDKEVLKLQTEIARIREENEILKKAIAMFAKEENLF
jgi:transposase